MFASLSFVGMMLSTAAMLSAGQQSASPDTQRDEGRFYVECVTLAENSPESARAVATEWRDRGGGVPARHCLALATAAMGEYREAAEQLEAIAEEFRVTEGGQAGQAFSTFDREMIADIYGQAGNAWILAGNPIRAYDILTVGISESRPTSPVRLELLIDRARASAELEDFEAAVIDLDEAQSIRPGRPDIYVFRANAHRVLEHWGEAEADIDRALELNSRHVGALLERGNLRRIQGDDEGARKDWLTILATEPDGPIADAARKNIEAMDVNIEEGEDGS